MGREEGREENAKKIFLRVGSEVFYFRGDYRPVGSDSGSLGWAISMPPPNSSSYRGLAENLLPQLVLRRPFGTFVFASFFPNLALP